MCSMSFAYAAGASLGKSKRARIARKRSIWNVCSAIRTYMIRLHRQINKTHVYFLTAKAYGFHDNFCIFTLKQMGTATCSVRAATRLDPMVSAWFYRFCRFIDFFSFEFSNDESVCVVFFSTGSSLGNRLSCSWFKVSTGYLAWNDEHTGQSTLRSHFSGSRCTDLIYRPYFVLCRTHSKTICDVGEVLLNTICCPFDSITTMKHVFFKYFAIAI